MSKYKIQCLNKISPIGTAKFDENYEFSGEMTSPDGILVRSASMHDMAFGEELLAIARAGAGVNNIPLDKCSEQGIVVFNTPGANANAVKELVIAALFLTSRKIIPAIDWAKTLKGQGAEVGKLVEKGKGAFAGPEIAGKTLGVVGLGAIGRMVANAARTLGMEVYGYDPFISVDAAWGLSRSIKHAHSLDEIYAVSDYITVHVPLNGETKHMIDAGALEKMKDGVRLLNFSRGELVDTGAILPALEKGKVSAYATDFPSDDILGVEGVVAIPHLGASTPESEDNCAVMAVEQMREFLENGIIINSVNLPALSMARDGNARLCIIHRNMPNTISAFTSACGDAGINIENMMSKSKGDYAYTILDVSNPVTDAHLEALKRLDPIIRVRLIP